MEHTHIIHKVVIEVSVNNRKKAYAIKDDISSFLAMDVFPKLEKHLNVVQAKIPAHTLQISQLVVDINHREASLGTTLKNDIITSFKKELGDILKNGSGQHLNPYLSQRRNQNPYYNPRQDKREFQYQDQYQDQYQEDAQNQAEMQNQDYEQRRSDAKRLNDIQNQNKRPNQNHGQGQDYEQNPDHGQRQYDGHGQNSGYHQNQKQDQNRSQNGNPNQHQNQSPNKSPNKSQRNGDHLHPDSNLRYSQSQNQNQPYGYNQHHDQNQYYDSNPYYEATDNPEVSFLGETEKLLRTFIHFIENGTMPWWNTQETAATIFEPVPFKKIISEKAFVARIIACLQKPKVRERLINQFTDAQITQICLTIIQAKGLKIALKSTVIKQLSGSSSVDRKVLWSFILQTLSLLASNRIADPETYTIEQITKTIPLLHTAKNKETEEQIWKAINLIFPFIEKRIPYRTFREADSKTVKNDTKNQHKEAHQQTDRNKIAPELFPTALSETPNADEVLNDYQLQNAGLVLIHPFMATLFKHCNLMDPKTNTLTDPGTCIHLLHYIATGKTNQPESAMLFEKYLCAIPLHQSINKHVKLTRKHKTEAAKVIGAVQQNWSAMKTASVGLLQHEFFQRPGKLTVDSQTLTIERKTQDILMDKLSWGISMIRLPWQSQFTYVNW